MSQIDKTPNRFETVPAFNIDQLPRPETDPDAWCQTYTGKAFFPFAPRVEDVCIEDIAHGLSNLCRYSGQSKKFYSVAEHSYLMSLAAGPSVPLALYALLHDATEAYIVDVPRPIKKYLKGYKEIELGIWVVIAIKFGLNPNIPPKIKEFDNRILLNEQAVLMAPPPRPWTSNVDLEPIPNLHIFCMPPNLAEAAFLKRFNWLMELKS